MPSGRVHKITTLAASPLAGAAAGYAASILGQQTGIDDGLRAGLACIAGMLATLAVGPDMDLLETTMASKVRRRKRLLPWWIFWYPYAAMIPHRHPVSHWPIVGTMVRLVYALAIVSVIVGGLAAAELIDIRTFPVINPPRWLASWFVLGMMFSDTVHWLLDSTS